MTVKLLMSWDIKPGQEQEYFEFVVREFVPRLTKLGLQPTEAYYTQYGNCPQILTGGTAEDLHTMRRILATDEWEALHSQLLEFVSNFEQKIVPASGRFQF